MKRISDNLLLIREGEQSLLAVRTSIEPRGYVAQQVSALARQGAVLVREGFLTPWPIHRVLPVDGEYYLAGPREEGSTLEELLARTSTRSVPPWLTAFFRAALNSLDHPEICLGNIRTTLITEDNSVLFLNAALAREINRSIPRHHRDLVYAPYADERLSGRAAVTYQVAAILYHALTGQAPATRDDEKETVITPIHTLRPTVNGEIAAAIDGILGSPLGDEHGLATIDRLLREVGGRWIESIPPEEEEQRKTDAAERHTHTRKSWERRTFWRRNRTRIVVIAAIVVLAGSVPYSMIRSRLQPPRTAGLNPIELVEGYYQAWTDLDHMFMEDAVRQGVARGTIREVTNIYVIDRVQTAHAMHSRFTSPAEWIAAGEPFDVVPYGVTDLHVETISREEARVVLQARYEFWRPGEVQEESRIEILRALVRDRLELEPTRHGWEITAIDTQVTEERTMRIER